MSDAELAYRTYTGVEIRPEIVAKFSQKARADDTSLIFVHTHPREDRPVFSPVDDAGEHRLKVFLDRRNAGHTHVSLVMGIDGVEARLIGGDEPVRVFQVGRTLDTFGNAVTTGLEMSAFDRQIRAFGIEAQEKLSSLRIGVVGVGGVGSVIVEELVHLGVTDLLLVDPDVIEPSNLNRVVGTTLKDVGQPKVDVAARWITALRPGNRVSAVRGSVLTTRVARELREVDFFFICTDSNGSRAVLNQLAYQYLIPAIDTGVAIAAKEAVVESVVGRVQMLAPGLGCLTCAELLDADAVRTDLMTDFERQADPYFMGSGVPQPAVMSLNATIASLAVTMFLGAVAGFPISPRFQLYDAVRGSVRAVQHEPVAACVVCSQRGALGRGDEWPLPTRNS